MFGGDDEVNAIVVDVGSFITRMGYAGEDTPNAIYPSVVGAVPGDENDGAGMMEVDSTAKRRQISSRTSATESLKYIVGDNQLCVRRNRMEILPVLDNEGLVSDWEALEQLWDYGFSTHMRLKLSEHPVLMSEPAWNTKEQRERICTLMFEKYDIPAFFVIKDACLSAFAAGRGTALVMNCGHRLSSAVPVFDGLVLRKGIRRTPIGGELLTSLIGQMLKKNGIDIAPIYSFSRSEIAPGEFEITYKDCPETANSYRDYMINDVVQDLKTKRFRVGERPYSPESDSKLPTVSCELPDGKPFDIGGDRFRIPEVLFNPSVCEIPPSMPSISDPPLPISRIVHDAIAASDSDIRRDLFNSVVLTGGTSLLPGLQERLRKELTSVLPQAMKVRLIAANAVTERRSAAWIGGSILASLGTFHSLWVSKQEFEDNGASICEKKCP